MQKISRRDFLILTSLTVSTIFAHTQDAIAEGGVYSDYTPEPLSPTPTATPASNITETELHLLERILFLEAPPYLPEYPKMTEPLASASIPSVTFMEVPHSSTMDDYYKLAIRNILSVIDNRVNDSRFPKSWQKVLTSPGQFSSYGRNPSFCNKAAQLTVDEIVEFKHGDNWTQEEKDAVDYGLALRREEQTDFIDGSTKNTLPQNGLYFLNPYTMKIAKDFFSYTKNVIYWPLSNFPLKKCGEDPAALKKPWLHIYLAEIRD